MHLIKVARKGSNPRFFVQEYHDVKEMTCLGKMVESR